MGLNLTLRWACIFCHSQRRTRYPPSEVIWGTLPFVAADEVGCDLAVFVPNFDLPPVCDGSGRGRYEHLIPDERTCTHSGGERRLAASRKTETVVP